MISKYDVIKSIDSAQKNGKKLAFIVSEDKKNILDSETNEVICSLDIYVQHIRKKLHMDFETLYENDATLEVVYRCKECGAIIFTSDNYEDYDPNLACPVCGEYKHTNFWTKEEVEKDIKKQKTLEFYEHRKEDEQEEDKRRTARNGLYDWQIFKKNFFGKMRSITFELRDFTRHLGPQKPWHLPRRPWYKNHLELIVSYYKKKQPDDYGYTMKNSITIPLSISAIRYKVRNKKGKKL